MLGTQEVSCPFTTSPSSRRSALVLALQLDSSCLSFLLEKVCMYLSTYPSLSGSVQPCVVLSSWHSFLSASPSRCRSYTCCRQKRKRERRKESCVRLQRATSFSSLRILLDPLECTYTEASHLATWSTSQGPQL